MKKYHEREKDTAQYSIQCKNDLFAATIGGPVVIQNPNSRISLEVSKGVKSIIKHEIQTDLEDLKDIIPRNECLVSPVVHFNTQESQAKQVGYKYKTTLPLVVSSQKHSIKVYHGDVHGGKSPLEIIEGRPENEIEPYYEKKKDTVALYSNHFSPSYATCEDKVCTSQIVALPFGKMDTEEEEPEVTVKTFLCNHLYTNQANVQVILYPIIQWYDITKRIIVGFP